MGDATNAFARLQERERGSDVQRARVQGKDWAALIIMLSFELRLNLPMLLAAYTIFDSYLSRFPS